MSSKWNWLIVPRILKLDEIIYKCLIFFVLLLFFFSSDRSFFKMDRNCVQIENRIDWQKTYWISTHSFFFFFFLTSLRSWIEKIRTLKWFSSYKKKKVKIFLLVLLAKPGFGIVCLLIVSLHWNRLLCLLENWGNFLKSGIVLFLLPVYKMMQEQSP